MPNLVATPAVGPYPCLRLAQELNPDGEFHRVKPYFSVSKEACARMQGPDLAGICACVPLSLLPPSPS